MRRTGLRLLAAASIGLFAWGCGAGADSGGTTLVRQHFAGLSGVASRPDLVELRGVLALPETQRLLDGVSAKLAAGVPAWFGASGAGDTNAAGVVPAVIRDLMAAESVLEVDGSASGVSGWALAARLEAPAANRAGQELGRVLAGRWSVPAPAAGVGEWTLGAAGGGPRARFVRTNGWVVVGAGPSVFERLRDGVGALGGLSNRVYTLKADLARVAELAGWWKAPPGPVDQWPALDLAVEPRSGRLRTTGQMRFSRPLAMTSDAWQLPRRVLREPLIGFTALRGAETWLSRLGLFASIPAKEWPSQLFLWSLAGPAWQQYFAGPHAAPTNLMVRLASEVPMRIMTNGFWKGQVFGLRVTNQASRIEMHGLPYFQPFLESTPEGDGGQIHGGLFRLPTLGITPPPDELMAQVSGRTNLVLYDWETTGQAVVVPNPPGHRGPASSTNLVGRLIHFKHLYQFLLMSTANRPGRLPSTASGTIAIPGGEWIDAAAPSLGDSVTEVTRSGPAELAFVRQSRTGFTAFELIQLLRWIGNPGFPGWQDPAPANEAEGERDGRPPLPAPPAPPAPAKRP